jgi:hypothetical protein
VRSAFLPFRHLLRSACAKVDAALQFARGRYLLSDVAPEEWVRAASAERDPDPRAVDPSGQLPQEDGTKTRTLP